jgi:hypothetical protein
LITYSLSRRYCSNVPTLIAFSCLTVASRYQINTCMQPVTALRHDEQRSQYRIRDTHTRGRTVRTLHSSALLDRHNTPLLPPPPLPPQLPPPLLPPLLPLLLPPLSPV